MKRPHGFRAFTGRQGFHSIYLITTQNASPVKVGIAVDPSERFSCIQTSNFVALQLYRAWWVAGRQISTRIERDFKAHFGARCVRGEWFDVPLPEAVAFIEAAVRAIGTWAVPEDQVVRLMDHNERRKYSMPPEAPSPLRGSLDYLNMASGGGRTPGRKSRRPRISATTG